MTISIYTAKLLKTILWMVLRSFEYTIKFSKGIYLPMQYVYIVDYQ